MGDIATKRLQLGLEDLYTSGPNSVYNGGVPVSATRRLAVKEDPSFDFVPTYERPKEARGTYAGLYTSILEQWQAKGKWTSAIYADDQIWIARMLISGSPTFTTLPIAPTTLLAATAIAATMSLTTQPNAAADGALAKILQLTLSNATTSTTAVTFTITGTDVNGNPLSETVTFSAGTQTASYQGGGAAALTSTLWTKNYFKTVTASGITTSAQPAGDQLAVAGVNAFQAVFLSDMTASTLYSATGEYFDGSVAWQLPGLVLSKGDWSATMGKSFDFSGDALAQQKKQLGSGTVGALTSLTDAIIGHIPTRLAQVWADPIGTTPGTTLLSARAIDWKLSLDNTVKLIKAADGTPYPNAVGRDYYGDKLTMETTLLLNSGTDPAELAQFLAPASRVVRFAYPGIVLPCGQLSTTGNWPVGLQQSAKGGYYGWMWDIAGRYTEATESKIDGRQALKFKAEAEVDLTTLTSALQLTVISRINPNWV